MMFTKKTLYILVTCSLEESRQTVLQEVIDNINKQECVDVLKDNIIVFDNASICKDTVDLLCKNFRNVYVSNKNVGYWSAMSWCLNNVSHEEYDYVHMIESDMLFDDYSKLSLCEDFLDRNSNLNCVRTSRFDVQNKHLYDKNNRSSRSNVNCWQTLLSCYKDPAYFTHIEGNFYKTNLPAVVCGLVRKSALMSVLRDLSTKNRFVEHDYQKLMFKLSNDIALYDGGLHVASTKTTVASSWPNTSSKYGYRESRADKIEDEHTYSVVKIEQRDV